MALRREGLVCPHVIPLSGTASLFGGYLGRAVELDRGVVEGCAPPVSDLALTFLLIPAGFPLSRSRYSTFHLPCRQQVTFK